MKASQTSAKHAHLLEDDLERYVATTSASDPSFRAAVEDAEDLQRVLDSLIRLRKALHLNQAEVARRMNVRQPTISGFENETSDPKLSTLQRYARAVQARLRLMVEMPATCDWISPAMLTYRTAHATARPAQAVKVGGGLVEAWKETRDSRADWAPAA